MYLFIVKFVLGDYIIDCEVLYNSANKFSFETIYKFATDIAKGMLYLHNNGVLHADLNSNNIVRKIYQIINFINFIYS